MLLKIVEIGFHTFEDRCGYIINFMNMQNNEENILTINNGYVKLESQFCRS